MLEIEKPIIECIESNEDGTYGKYVVEPLERGYGITLGNAMRRILLSSLPGVATTSIKIDGVLHEFSTVQGVKEDVTELILNIKCLALTMEGEGPQTIYIDAKGPGVVTGADIKTEIIAASVRHPVHVTQCALAGADIATVPYKVLEQMLHHPLTDAGIVKFQNDYRAVFGDK